MKQTVAFQSFAVVCIKELFEAFINMPSKCQDIAKELTISLAKNALKPWHFCHFAK
jgi:hypothetical protein